MKPTHFCCIYMSLVSLILPSLAALGAETGQIRTFYIGDSFMRPGFPTPGMAEDPKISLTRLESEVAFEWITMKDMHKAMRIYLPRTGKQLRESYDLVIIAAIKAQHLSHAFQLWVAEAVLEGDLAFLMADDPVSFGCVDAWQGSGAVGWMETPVGVILPVEDDSRVNYEDVKFRFKPDPEFESDPFNVGIPWEDVVVFSHNKPSEKPGSKVVLRSADEYATSGFRDPVIRSAPVVAYWDIEQGRTAAVMFDWGGNFRTDFYQWEYWKDVVARFVYLPAKAEIPTDVELTHAVRQQFADYNVLRGITISMLEFADKMGANTAKVEEELGAVSEDRMRANELWIQGEFEESHSTMMIAIEGLGRVSDMALEAKDSALFWIYVSEWTAVSGTLCATGGVLWTLMIRRRVYREVVTTTFREEH